MRPLAPPFGCWSWLKSLQMCKIEISVPCNGKMGWCWHGGEFPASATTASFLSLTNLSISRSFWAKQMYLLQKRHWKCHWKCHSDILAVMEERQIADADFRKRTVDREIRPSLFGRLFKARAVCTFYITVLLEFVWTFVSASLLMVFFSRDASDLSLPGSTHTYFPLTLPLRPHSIVCTDWFSQTERPM